MFFYAWMSTFVTDRGVAGKREVYMSASQAFSKLSLLICSTVFKFGVHPMETQR